MSTNTTNYNLIKPAVNDPTDEDLWGGMTNDNWDTLDSLLKTINRVGKFEPCFDITAPSGWLFMDALTIGNAASSGTSRANADTEELFTFLWDNLADAEAPVSSGRGANASADYAANKTITIPDFRGRTPFGADDMGNSAAGRLTSGISGVDGLTVGASGGDESLQGHTHTASQASQTTNIDYSSGLNGGSGGGHEFYERPGGTNAGSDNKAVSAGAITVNSTGNGVSENVPPAIVVNWIIKL